MSRVPSYPPKRQPDLLDEIQKIIDPQAEAGKKARADFIRNKLASIGNEIDAKVKRKS